MRLSYEIKYDYPNISLDFYKTTDYNISRSQSESRNFIRTGPGYERRESQRRAYIFMGKTYRDNKKQPDNQRTHV